MRIHVREDTENCREDIRMKSRLFVAAVTYLLTSHVGASDATTVEPDGDSYHYVSHFSIEIDAPIERVWENLIDVGSWMYEFELTLVAGTPGTEGEVRRLYEGQEFLIEITKVIPNELLVFANLPSSFNGEYSTGVAVITLDEAGGVTKVRLTMSRRYSWESDTPNTQRLMRESAEFSERTKAMWQHRFLGRLRSLSES